MKSSRRIESLAAWHRATRSGLPLTRSLELLRGPTLTPEDDRHLAELIRGAEAGRSLEQARGQLEALYGAAIAGLLIAGERSGTLEAQLESALSLQRAAQDLDRKLMMALAYPSFLAVTGLVLLPLPTVFALGPLAAIQKVYLPLGLGAGLIGALAAGLIQVWRAGGPRRITLERAILRTPILRQLLSSSGTTLFFRTLAAALEAGTGPGEACRMACRASGLECLAVLAESLARRLDAGAPFSATLPAAGIFSPGALQQVGIGEETGTLPAQLGALAASEQENLARSGTTLAVALGVGAVVLVGLGLLVAIVSFWSHYFAQFSELGV